MFRIANSRQAKIKDCEVQVFCTVHDAARKFTRIVELKLVRSLNHTLEKYPWTLIHVIDEESPFFKDSWEDVCAQLDMIFIHIKGADVVANAQLYAEHRYALEDVKINFKLVDLITQKIVALPDGSRVRHSVCNFKHFHRIEPQPSGRFQELAIFGGANTSLNAIY